VPGFFEIAKTRRNIRTPHALGLGTVVVGLFDHAKTAGALKVPGRYELVAMIPLRFPVKISSAPDRQEVAELLH